MKEKIKKFLRYPWTSKMVLESVRQYDGGRHLATSIAVAYVVSDVVTRSMTWRFTIDDDDYWHPIYSETSRTRL